MAYRVKITGFNSYDYRTKHICLGRLEHAVEDWEDVSHWYSRVIIHETIHMILEREFGMDTCKKLDDMPWFYLFI